jgi:hypothetical protein
VTVTTNDPDEASVVVTLSGDGGQPVAPTGLQTDEVVDDLLGLVELDVDVNVDGAEDAADVVMNQSQVPTGP